MKGIVTKSTGSWYEVRTEDGSAVPCRLRGQFRQKGIKTTNPVVVGDYVSFLLEKDETGWINEIEPRKNYIERKSTNLSKLSHMIASNIDRAFLFVTLKEPLTSPGFIDRFLVAAEAYRVPVCLVFNKIDFYNGKELEKVDEISLIYENIGYQTLRTSTINGTGVSELKAMMTGKVSLFSGHSGTGKSAMLNAIEPECQVKIGSISKVHNKGKHTTTFAQMFPVLEDSFIIDTPGIKEFGLLQYNKAEIRDCFPEIRAYNNCCKFHNCQHLHEPDCAVIKAVEHHKIALSRYRNYLALLEDDDLKIADWELC